MWLGSTSQGRVFHITEIGCILRLPQIQQGNPPHAPIPACSTGKCDNGKRMSLIITKALCSMLPYLLIQMMWNVKGVHAGSSATKGLHLNIPGHNSSVTYSSAGLHLECNPNMNPHFSHESRLINCLLDRYNRVTTLARPVRDSSNNVVIDFGVSLIQILDFDEIKQVLTTSIWKNYVWTDQVLRWDPTKFGDVTHIRLPATHIWTPDIVLYNNADEQVKQHEELAAVYFNGTVKWIPPAIYRSSCEIDMKNFPFDVQTCYFKFGSWTYDQHKVDLKLFEERTHIDLREYVRSSEWDILNTTAGRIIRRYQFFDTDPYPELTFTITIKRQSTFYIYLLVLPCILLSSLTLVLFWIPPQRPDRTAVGMSLFSSFFILLLILVQSSPPTSASISRLGINYCVNMVLIALSTILSVVIINIGQTKGRRRWLSRKHLKIFATALCIRRYSFSSDHSDEARENGIYMECLNPTSGVSRQNSHQPSTEHYSDQSPVKPAEEYHHTPKPDPTWTLVAAVLDRIFFFIYLFIIVLSIVFIFPR